MSANQYVNSICIFQGTQGKYYIVDGCKYDIHFPLAQALDHKTYPDDPECGSGPKECYTCLTRGSVNGVFVGYCENCLFHVYGQTEDNVSYESAEAMMWAQYPYMYGVGLHEIGDVEAASTQEAVIEQWFATESAMFAEYYDNLARMNNDTFEDEAEEEENYVETPTWLQQYHTIDGSNIRAAESVGAGEYIKYTEEELFAEAESSVAECFAEHWAEYAEYYDEQERIAKEIADEEYYNDANYDNYAEPRGYRD